MRATESARAVALILLCGLSACMRPPKAAPPQAPAAPQPFQNRGGMWMPEQMAGHAAMLKQLGLKIEPKALTDPQAEPLASVVFLGGCSASFVSPAGLILTNHHCAVPALQHSSTLRHNLTKDGYIAKSRLDEKSNGPAARVFVTQKQTDVTDHMLRGLATIVDDRARFLESEKRSKALVRACEAKGPHVRCQVSSFFGGARHVLIERLEIKDVRLVYAPPAGIGNFGGEVDNWRWPRHAGDFTFFRAYVAPDGKPAEYSLRNVPYMPPVHAKVAGSPLREGDLVWAAGYPGHTEQLATPHEIDELVNWYLPYRVRYCEENVAAIERVAARDADAALKGYAAVRGLDNQKKALQGALLGLSGGVATQKRAQYEAFRQWVTKNDRPQLAVLQELEQLLEARSKTRAVRANFDELMQASVLLQAALQIVRGAQERAKVDEERKPAFQERNLPNLRAELESLDQRFAAKIDTARLLLAVERVARGALNDRPPAFKALGGEIVQPAARTKFITGLFLGSSLVNKGNRLKHFDAEWKRIEKHWDPLLKVAREVLPAVIAREAEDEAFQGKLLRIWPRYFALLQKFAGQPLAPDANRTLRITYGTVKGYRPSPTQQPFPAFTHVGQIPAKHTDKEPFDAPKALLEKIQGREFGSYADPLSGEVPVNFVADLHITGGNSGSPTFDAEGKLVGVVFDGNYEALASNWHYQPDLTRSIHVDVRYILWLLSTVHPAPALLEEMGITAPATPAP